MDMVSGRIIHNPWFGVRMPQARATARTGSVGSAYMKLEGQAVSLPFQRAHHLSCT